MSRPSNVFVLVLAGEERDACAFAQQRYPTAQIALVSKLALRESGWKQRLRELRKLSGEALVIFTDSLASLQEPLLLKWTSLVHRCRETVLADSSGAFEVIPRLGALLLLPRTLIAALTDAAVLVFTWAGLQCFRLWLKFRSAPQALDGSCDVAFLYPSQTGLDSPGGALSHVTGFLSGVLQEGTGIAVFSGRRFQSLCGLHHILGVSRPNLFRELASLSYNIRFTVVVRKLLARTRPRLLYQRHGRFLFAGALLSRLLNIPLVLEYNGCEDWIAKHWDPTRFSAWLRLCQRVSVDAASLIAVVSNPLKHQLIDAGVPAYKILVNQNAVDPEWFRPDCGGAKLRDELGFRRDELGFARTDVVVCFVGTFSYWHGVAVLEEAIRSLLQAQSNVAVKFLLVGDGPLAQPMRNALADYAKERLVIFTGSIPHKSVREHLDAADILVSPHVPMPGDVPFFGSPTKLFEYMAMGKAIVASGLDQIADVLEHGRTAFLVKPGDASDLAKGIQHLAANPQLRETLGANARSTALERHTWRQNARRVLAYYAQSPEPAAGSAIGVRAAVGSSSRGSTSLAKQNL
jgi:glycosyltransferase involved in cell wall biosynthesis